MPRLCPLCECDHNYTGPCPWSEELEMPMEPKAEVDMWTRIMEVRKQELIEEGVPAEEAEDRACSEIRRQIRNS